MSREPIINSVNFRLHILASLFAALTAVGAFIRLPIPYVPLTLQTFFVILSGALLGPRFGALSQILYLAVGLLGVPIFANGGGPGYVLQPSFGYLLAYPAAAYVIGFILWGWNPSGAPPKLATLRILTANLAGLCLIYLLGVMGLYFNLNFVMGKTTTLAHAVWIGCIVFLPGSVVKVAVATFLVPKMQRVLVMRST